MVVLDFGYDIPRLLLGLLSESLVFRESADSKTVSPWLVFQVIVYIPFFFQSWFLFNISCFSCSHWFPFGLFWLSGSLLLGQGLPFSSSNSFPPEIGFFYVLLSSRCSCSPYGKSSFSFESLLTVVSYLVFLYENLYIWFVAVTIFFGLLISLPFAWLSLSLLLVAVAP